MGIFNFGKRDRFVDLREPYQISQATQKTKPEVVQPIQAPQIKTFENPVKENLQKNPEDAEERKRKFAKRLMEMFERVELISTQLHHLTQRVEVLEKKLNA
jgi:hypothetical protein